MKVLFINTTNISGGAARAAYRLFEGIKDVDNEINSYFLVQKKENSNNRVIGPKGNFGDLFTSFNALVDKIPLQFYKNRKKITFSISWFYNDFLKQINKIKPDVLHFHWICNGFIPISLIKKIKVPVVWTLHDCWPFTGGCHYPFDCLKYEQNCGQCPQLASKSNIDLSRKIWNKKKKSYKNLNLTVISPSIWLSECAKKSNLFFNKRIEVIPNGIDITVFKPIKKNIAREILNFPKDKTLILFGAVNSIENERKGFRYLCEALKNYLKKSVKNDIELIIFGSSEPKDPINFGIKTRYIDKISDDYTLSILYSAVNVFLAPSIQENFSNTVLESLSCGTPVVAFDIGGMPDMIDHRLNGYLVEPFNVDDFANGIKFIIENPNVELLSKKSREKVIEKYSISKVAEKYIEIYKDILRNIDK